MDPPHFCQAHFIHRLLLQRDNVVGLYTQALIHIKLHYLTCSFSNISSIMLPYMRDPLHEENTSCTMIVPYFTLATLCQVGEKFFPCSLPTLRSKKYPCCLSIPPSLIIWGGNQMTLPPQCIHTPCCPMMKVSCQTPSIHIPLRKGHVS